jgi:hypothetical protein
LELVRRTGSNSALDCDERLLRGGRSLIDDNSCAETLNLIQVKNEPCSSQDGHVRFTTKSGHGPLVGKGNPPAMKVDFSCDDIKELVATDGSLATAHER